MTTQIVTVNIAQIVAPTPNTLQSTGCILTEGGLAPAHRGLTPRLLTVASDLQKYINTTPSPKTIELTAAVNKFFEQGSNQSVYVMDTIIHDGDDGVASLAAYIANPSIIMYGWLLPKAWADSADMIALAESKSGEKDAVYFWVSATFSNYASWSGIKSVFMMVQETGSTEVSVAAAFQSALASNPSSTNPVYPFSYRYLKNVTPINVGSGRAALKAAGANWVDTGSEGGLSNTLISGGTMADKNPWNYWFAIDWVNINLHQALAAEVIRMSNPPAPGYYDQPGINRLRKAAQVRIDNGVAYGVVQGPVFVTAIPYKTYITDKPSDYSIGKYAGLAVTFVPQRGFDAITLNLTASNVPQ